MSSLRFALSLGKSSLILSLGKRSRPRSLIPRAPIQASSALKLSVGADAQRDERAQDVAHELALISEHLQQSWEMLLNGTYGLLCSPQGGRGAESAAPLLVCRQEGTSTACFCKTGMPAAPLTAAMPKATQHPPHTATPPKAMMPQPRCKKDRDGWHRGAGGP